MYTSLMMLPMKFKMIFGMIIDTKVITTRSHLLVAAGAVSVLVQLSIYFDIVSDEISFLLALALNDLCLTVIESTIASYIVE
jgi:hypothetical protein